VTIPLGVDLINFHPRNRDESLRTELLKGADILLVHCGRLSPEKKPERSMQALELLLQQGINAHLVYVGIGPLQKKLMQESKNLPVTFLGYGGETLSLAFAGEGQHQDSGAKMVHAAPYTSSSVISKSVARNGGRTSYRGLVQVQEGAHHSASTVKCDALLVDTISRSDTYPYVDIREDDVSMGHEATVSKISDDQLFYLMSRGLNEDEAMAMIVRGFIEPIARELPMEYALELNRLIELQMEGAVG
jgi:glycosyltransferase involved in cell wall biosynthesis